MLKRNDVFFIYRPPNIAYDIPLLTVASLVLVTSLPGSLASQASHLHPPARDLPLSAMLTTKGPSLLTYMME